MNDIFYLSAVDMAKAVRNRDVSVQELIQAHIDRAHDINPGINALVSERYEDALADAKAADAAIAAGRTLGPLFGLPVAHKDSYMVRGVRTTYGSRAFQDFVPDQDSAVVARQRAAGAIILGKTNMPEFGAGSHTFNDVFGVTRNPYRLDKSAGGSSGGAAAALAAGLVALADGSDMGGSLRNPASFCNVVGLRPSLGRVPMSPTGFPFNTLTTGGPMGRKVADVALMLEVIAGADAQDPLAVETRPGDFFPLPDIDPKGTRIALSRTLGGLPFEPSVQASLQDAVGHLESMGCIVDEDEPDFSDADQAFETLRALAFATNYEALRAAQGNLLKDTVKWNIDLGLALKGSDVTAAQRAQGRMFNRMADLLKRYDFLVAPVSQVAPFAVETEYPQQIAGIDMPHYIGWMRSCYRITVTGHPAISLPCSFTADGLPIGIQIVGSYRKERELLAFAQAFEKASPAGDIRPSFR